MTHKTDKIMKISKVLHSLKQSTPQVNQHLMGKPYQVTIYLVCGYRKWSLRLKYQIKFTDFLNSKCKSLVFLQSAFNCPIQNNPIISTIKSCNEYNYSHISVYATPRQDRTFGSCFLCRPGTCPRRKHQKRREKLPLR